MQIRDGAGATLLWRVYNDGVLRSRAQSGLEVVPEHSYATLLWRIHNDEDFGFEPTTQEPQESSLGEARRWGSSSTDFLDTAMVHKQREMVGEVASRGEPADHLRKLKNDLRSLSTLRVTVSYRSAPRAQRASAQRSERSERSEALA